MRKKTTYLFVLGIVVTVVLSAGFVLAQNANSSTTMTSNSNMAKPKPRRHKPKAKAAAATSEAATTEPAQPEPTVTTRRKRTGRCDPTQQEQTDLSGTYTGRVKHGDEPVMDATLTVTGNNFTMTSGSDTHSGRIAAVTTCGYTAVTVMMGDPMKSGANPPMTVSLRAKKMGDRLTLTSVPGEPQKVSFTTGGGMMKAKPRRSKKPKTAAPTTPPQQPPQ